MPNYVQEYDKQDKNTQNYFRKNKTAGMQYNFSPYKVYCTVDNSYKHILRLSIEKNRFPAKNQTLRCYRV